jgi:hypothetical protein
MQCSAAKHRIRTKFKHQAARYAEDLTKSKILNIFRTNDLWTESVEKTGKGVNGTPVAFVNRP